MEIAYSRYSPTQNMTALVESPVDEALFSDLSAAIMRADAEIEQVGFLRRSEKAALSLCMAGGEFCGNAAMAAAEHVCRTLGRVAAVSLEVSGAADIVRCEPTELGGERLWTVAMPLPQSVQGISLTLEGVVYPVQAVRFPGITHLVLDAHALSRTAAEQAVRQWAEALGVGALGLLFFDEQQSAIRPLVFVSGTGSLVWERGCGSGSAAVGAWLASRRQQTTTVPVRQPGGVITVHAVYEERLCGLTLTGRVCFSGDRVQRVSSQ